MLRSLGDSLIEVIGAEWTALTGDLRSSGRRFSLAVGLLALAAFLLFWAVGAAGFVLFEILILWVPGWAAALVVCGVFLVVGLTVGLVGRKRLRTLELPADTVRRRLDDHMEWWQSNLLGDEGDESAQQLGGGADPGQESSGSER